MLESYNSKSESIQKLMEELKAIVFQKIMHKYRDMFILRTHFAIFV